jgi:hypothetical protein
MLDSIKRPELFFGLVAPIGVNLESTATELAKSLRRHDYKVHILKVTDIFRAIRNQKSSCTQGRSFDDINRTSNSEMPSDKNTTTTRS